MESGGLHPDRPGGSAVHPGEGEAAEQTGRDVVGVALDLGGQLQQRGVVEPVVAAYGHGAGGDDAGADGGGGGAEAAAVRDAVGADDLQAAGLPAEQVEGGAQGTYEQVALVARAASRRPHPRCRCAGRSRPPGRRRRRRAPATGRGRRSPGRGWRWWRGRAPGRRRRGTRDRPSLDDSPCSCGIANDCSSGDCECRDGEDAGAVRDGADAGTRTARGICGGAGSVQPIEGRFCRDIGRTGGARCVSQAPCAPPVAVLCRAIPRLSCGRLRARLPAVSGGARADPPVRGRRSTRGRGARPRSPRRPGR